MEYGNQSYEKPVKENSEYDVTIDEVGIKGDGIARVQGFVVFVPNTKKGEKARIRVTQVMRRFAIGEKIGAATGATEAPTAETTEATADATTESETAEAPAEETTEEAPAEESTETPAEEAPAEETEEKPAESEEVEFEEK